ncbi:hypothetical protein V5049_05350 [Moellerella wisconsensis]|uniref:hypothetical protein n=1 Tax=Moellerella wisconsensis TaxID=158849 RepID=UPI0030763535
MTDKTGGAAFPASGHPDMQFVAQEGMTLRDYFAIRLIEKAAYKIPRGQACEFDDICRIAYELADAMLKARG